MGINREKLQGMTAVLEREIGKGTLAGGGVLVFHRGEEQFSAFRGFASRESGAPMARDTICRMYSMSKPLTSAAAMVLYERGDLDLMAPVEAFLPGFKNQKVAVGGRLEPVPSLRPCLVKDLLDMTAGLTYPGTQTVAEWHMDKLFRQVKSEQDAGKGPSTLEMANRIGEQPLEFAPGQGWKYSTCADVLGAVIEVASGQRFGEFLKEQILDPLGMLDTGFSVPEEKRSRIAQVYELTPQGLIPHPGCHLCVGPVEGTGFESGGAGLFSTIQDYGRFARMLTLGGAFEGKQILSRKTWEFMRSPALNDTQLACFDHWLTLEGFSYGNLMRVCLFPGQSYMPSTPGEFGWDGWLGVHFLADPAEELSFVFTMQRANCGTIEITRKLRAVLYSALD